MRRLGGRCSRFFAVVVSSSLSWAQEPEDIVREIEVRFTGPETVNRSVVMANIQTAVGKPRSRDMIEQDVRNLINTGYFFDVRVLEEPVVDGVRSCSRCRARPRSRKSSSRATSGSRRSACARVQPEGGRHHGRAQGPR
jgi:hypothetical protein